MSVTHIKETVPQHSQPVHKYIEVVQSNFLALTDL